MEGLAWTKKIAEFDKLSLMLASFSLVMYTISVCNSISLLALCCQHEVLQCGSRHLSYLWFLLQSVVHPPVARQSPLFHGMMPEVIIISKNLHKHKGKGNEFTCGNRVDRLHSVLNKAFMCTQANVQIMFISVRVLTVHMDIGVWHFLLVFKAKWVLLHRRVERVHLYSIKDQKKTTTQFCLHRKTSCLLPVKSGKRHMRVIVVEHRKWVSYYWLNVLHKFPRASRVRNLLNRTKILVSAFQKIIENLIKNLSIHWATKPRWTGGNLEEDFGSADWNKCQTQVRHTHRKLSII